MYRQLPTDEWGGRAVIIISDGFRAPSLYRCPAQAFFKGSETVLKQNDPHVGYSQSGHQTDRQVKEGPVSRGIRFATGRSRLHSCLAHADTVARLPAGYHMPSTKKTPYETPPKANNIGCRAAFLLTISRRTNRSNSPAELPALGRRPSQQPSQAKQVRRKRRRCRTVPAQLHQTGQAVEQPRREQRRRRRRRRYGARWCVDAGLGGGRACCRSSRDRASRLRSCWLFEMVWSSVRGRRPS